MNIERTIKITLTPMELAEIFSGWDGDQQAEFFSRAGEITDRWDRNFCFQAQWIADSECLNQHGRDFMAVIGDYGRQESIKNEDKTHG